MDYILNRVNYQTLIMMLSDAPRYRSGSGRRPASGRISETTPEQEADAVTDFFVSNLRQ